VPSRSPGLGASAASASATSASVVKARRTREKLVRSDEQRDQQSVSVIASARTARQVAASSWRDSSAHASSASAPVAAASTA
jgi:hypothetical protein